MKAQTRNLLQKLDWFMILAVLALMSIGVAFIYSAGFQPDSAFISEMHNRQLIWMIVGIVIFIAASLFDYHRLADHVLWIYVAAIILLILVYFIGQRINSAYRWFTVFGINVQPAELAKIAMVISLAAFLSKPGRSLKDVPTLMITLGMVLVPFVLIAGQPDLGTATVLVPLTLVILFTAGLPLRTFGFLLMVGLFVCLPIGWLLLEEYQLERIMVFLGLSEDPNNTGWNVRQSLLAVGSGGLWGKGYLQGVLNMLGYLPRDVAPTDFIFSVIAEEKGFVGAVGLIALYLVIFHRLTRAAIRAPDRLGRLIAVGVLGMLFAHVFVNIAMTIGLMPVTGLPLPLVSYGGSFMISTMVSLGITQSVYIRRYER